MLTGHSQNLENVSGTVRGSSVDPISASAPCSPSSRYTRIHNIPTELIAMIFQHCMPQDIYITPRNSESPMLLTKVCRRWRQIALSTPQLWAALNVTTLFAHANWTEMVQTWLPRAGRVPASLRITEVGYTTASFLAPFLPQLGRLELHCNESLLDRQLSQQSISLPHLKCLDVTINGLSGWHEWLASIVAAATNLDSIRWAGANATSPPRQIFSGQLRHLSITNPILFDSVIEIIDICSQAETLKFIIAALGTAEPTVVPTSEIILPNIVNLELGYESKGHSAQLRMLLNCITAPLLQRITIAAFDWPQRPLLNLFERSECSIRSLQCTGSDIWNCQIIECLSHPCVSSTIETFIVAGRGYCVDDKVLKALSFDDKTRSCIAAKLSKVTFTGELNTGQDVWDNMNQSRSENGYPALVNVGDNPLTFKRATGSLSFMFYPGFTSQMVVKSGQSDSVRVFRRLPTLTDILTDEGPSGTTTYELHRSPTEEHIPWGDRRTGCHRLSTMTFRPRPRTHMPGYFASPPSSSSRGTSPTRRQARRTTFGGRYIEDDLMSDFDDEPHFGPHRFFFSSPNVNPVPSDTPSANVMDHIHAEDDPVRESHDDEEEGEDSATIPAPPPSAE